MCHLKITSVKFLADYMLSISLSNSHCIMYDMKSKIKTARFQPLQNETIFQTGTLAPDGVIHWKCGIELALDEILMELTNKMPYRI